MIMDRADVTPWVPSFPQRGDQISAAQALQAPPVLPVLKEAGPDVYAYRDYRRFLTDWFAWKKSVQPHYSGALFAKKAGFNSHTLLGMVIRGQRNLSPTSIRAFCRALGFKAQEGTYFEKLVLFNQARNPQDQAYYQAQLSAAAEDSKSADGQGPSLTLTVDARDLPRLKERLEACLEGFARELGGDHPTPGAAGNRVVLIATQISVIEEAVRTPA